MNWAQLWLNRYEEVKRWIRPYLGGRIRLNEVDVFCIWAYYDMMKFKYDEFIIVDKTRRYTFHKPTGYLLHVFMRYASHFAKPKFGQKIIRRIERIEPGRKIVYAERKVPGPRGGKLWALGSATHITTDAKVVNNPYTRKYLKLLKVKIPNELNIRYPNFYEAERKYWYKPFEKYFKDYAIKNLWPEI